jgi:prepilin-type N-terminal cleavage/methylation domain-containing protein
MSIMNMNRAGHSTRRAAAGFTLLELLIVMSIIALLAALVAGATVLYIGQQRESNTKTTIAKVYRELRSQWDQVISDAKADILASKVPADVVSLAGPASDGGARAERANVIYIKLKLRQQFPMNYTEIMNPTFAGISSAEFAPPQEYQDALKKYPAVRLSSPPTPAESGACLLIALTTKARGGKLLPADTFFSSQEIADTNGDGAPELIDGWGNPLVFYRWPTQNEDLPALDPDKKGQDPGDPTGTLLSNLSWNTASSSLCGQFESMCHLVHDPTAGTYTPKSWYLSPVVASLGQDGMPGIEPVQAGQPDPMRPWKYVSATPISSPGTQTVTLAPPWTQCMFTVQQTIVVDPDNAPVTETVIVSAIPNPNQFQATFSKAHSANFTVMALGANDNIYSYRVVPR